MVVHWTHAPEVRFKSDICYCRKVNELGRGRLQELNPAFCIGEKGKRERLHNQYPNSWESWTQERLKPKAPKFIINKKW